MRQLSNEFQSKITNALLEQEKHNGKLREEIQGIRAHGGLGYRFLTTLKILAVLIFFSVLVSGIYIYTMVPALRSAYSFSVLSAGFVLSVLYLRKLHDKRME